MPILLIAAVIFGTWNANWFPSGRADHRANPTIEEATAKASGKFIRQGVARLDPTGTNDLVLAFNEIRDSESAEALCAAIGRTNLHIAVVSDYRRRNRHDYQQDVIMTTLSIVEAHWSAWRSEKGVTPPRGYAYALVTPNPAITAAVYAVHLKSNYGATSEEDSKGNFLRREICARQIAAIVHPRRRGHKGPVAVLGDFNTDPWRGEFANERTIDILEQEKLSDVLSALKPGLRGTHPTRKWGNSALDHIFLRGFAMKEPPQIVPSEELSDHSLVLVAIEAEAKK